MSLPLRHPLHRERYRAAQCWLRAADAWLQQRERINDLRLRHLRSGDTARDVCRAAMDRLYAVRESQPLFCMYQEKGVMAGLLQSARQVESREDYGLTDTLIADRQAERDRCDGESLTPVLPPGVENIVQTPRRPGAPSITAV